MYGIFEFNIYSGRLTQYPFTTKINASTIQSTYTTVDEDENIWIRVLSNNDPYIVFNKSSHKYSSQLADDPPHSIFFIEHKMITAFYEKLF